MSNRVFLEKGDKDDWIATKTRRTSQGLEEVFKVVFTEKPSNEYVISTLEKLEGNKFKEGMKK